MKDDEFAHVLERIVPPTPRTGGWLDGARRRRRRRRGIAAGAVGVVVLALAVPLGMNLGAGPIDALPADVETTHAVALCNSTNVLEPAVGVDRPEAFVRGVVCTGTVLAEDPREIELPAELVRSVATSMLRDSWPDSSGGWAYEDSALVLATDDDARAELWQVSLLPGELSYLWRRADGFMVWTPGPDVASQLREHLGVE